MPKGRVEPREVTCRGCTREFVSDRPGKAAWFCDTCKEQRGQKPARARLEREAAAHRREEERDAARRAREAQQVRARAEQEATRRAEVERRVAERRAVERAAELAKVREQLGRAIVEEREKGDRVRELQERIAELEPSRLRLRHAPRPRVVEPEPIIEPTRELTADAAGELGQLLAHLRRSMVRRSLDARPVGKASLRLAIQRLTIAAGIPDTRSALRAVAVEALVWDFRLSGRDRDPGELATEDTLAVVA